MIVGEAAAKADDDRRGSRKSITIDGGGSGPMAGKERHPGEEPMVPSAAGALARKRPSPLLGGKPTTWACGIVRTIGWVNFLDDLSQEPHMKLTAIDKAFGVGESTGQGKSMLIRKMLKIRPMDPAWSLRSRMDRNPMAWMIQMDGFLVDARILKREYQEEALRRGLIPYIPGDRAKGQAEE
jgi:hypothetical protein